jgi:hypothetical protein
VFAAETARRENRVVDFTEFKKGCEEGKIVGY